MARLPLFVFNQGLQKLLKEAVADRQSEMLAMAKVAKRLRKEMLEWKPPQFAGSFPSDCCDNLSQLRTIEHSNCTYF